MNTTLNEAVRRFGVEVEDRGRVLICGVCATESATVTETEDGLIIVPEGSDGEAFPCETARPYLDDRCDWCASASMETVWTGEAWECRD